jgi:hypothetical protein
MITFEDLSRMDEEDNRDFLEIAGDGLIKRLNRSGDTYFERLEIDDNGRLKLPTQEGAGMVSFFAHCGSDSVESLMQLAQKVQERYPDLQFSFEQDPEGRWIQYAVTRTNTLGH